MTSSTHHATDQSETVAPLARIEAQDELWAAMLREYLERHGCRVVTNGEAGGNPEYVIAAGDAGFVKTFFEATKWPTKKKMAVVYGCDADGLSDLRSHGVKQFVVDPKPLDEQRTREIFAFFFTADEPVKDVRKEPAVLQKSDVIRTEALREASDEKRIARELDEVYRKSQKPKRLLLHPFYGACRHATWFGVMALSIAIPVLFYLLSVAASVGLLALGAKTLASGDMRWTRALISSGSAYQGMAQSALTFASPLFVVSGQGGMVEDQDRLLSIITQVASAESGVLTIFQSSKKVAAGILFPNDTSKSAGVSDVIALETEVSRVSQHLDLVAAQLESLVASRRFPFHTRAVSAFTSKAIIKLNTLRKIVGFTDKLLTLYPRSAGFRRKQTYLILLQNSMELRPTGGFIGSLLLSSFAEGKVESLEVQDVYTADGQLKGHVDPPLPIREILGSEHWYLRDSNWDPDFAASGEKAAWFYEKEMNQSVDGVIALSLPLVTKLLSVTGPIELLDFNERISESNFFAKSLLYTETNFFPGSTQKKDFLGALTTSLLSRITTDPSLSAGALLAVLTEGIEARDVQFYFTDSELQSLVRLWGWEGGAHIRPCQMYGRNVSCIGDGIGIVDANLGVNKANFFVTRQAASHISLSENGDIDQTLTIRMKNDAAGATQGGGGAYLTYPRFLLPLGTELITATLDGAAIPMRDRTNPAPPPAPYVTTDTTATMTTIGVPFTVEKGQTRQLTLRFVRRGALVFEDLGTYQFAIRKQPGVRALPWQIVVEYPARWAVSREDGVAKPGSLEYNTDLTKDATFRMLFQKANQ